MIEPRHADQSRADEGRAAEATRRLRAAELRPTRQRIALCRLLFSPGDRHVTAEALHDEAVRAGVRVSLATVYNTLHQFTAAGLLRQVVVDGSRTYFDTNTKTHHHFFREAEGELIDIPGDQIAVSGLPASPEGTQIARVDVIVRLSSARS
ncbi:MAG: transcriptional repressor [Alphaproteobacteria bacterium]|nr:transcriptional repressor [Alphaproteobacteria bacterium]